MRRRVIFCATGGADDYRLRGRLVGDGDGVCRWPHLRRTLQSGGDLRAGGRRPVPERAVSYIVAQLLGGAAAAGVFYLVLTGAPPAKWNNFTTISNLYGSGGFSMGAVFLTETVITALFLVVIVGATSQRAPAGFAPIAIGLALTMFHLVAIPISNASLNPARSTATAIFGGAQAINALWLFWVAPILGGVIGGLICRWLQNEMPKRKGRP